MWELTGKRVLASHGCDVSAHLLQAPCQPWEGGDLSWVLARGRYPGSCNACVPGRRDGLQNPQGWSGRLPGGSGVCWHLGVGERTQQARKTRDLGSVLDTSLETPSAIQVEMSSQPCIHRTQSRGLCERRKGQGMANSNHLHGEEPPKKNGGLAPRSERPAKAPL